MKPFLVHCGFYDNEVSQGLYEFHTNFFIVAESFEMARAKAKLQPDFQRKRMHVDGIQMIEAVQGHRLFLKEELELNGETKTQLKHHRDLAPAPVSGN